MIQMSKQFINTNGANVKLNLHWIKRNRTSYKTLDC